MVMVVPKLLLEVVKQVGAGLEQFTLDQTPTTPIPDNCEFCIAVEVVEQLQTVFPIDRGDLSLWIILCEADPE